MDSRGGTLPVDDCRPTGMGDDGAMARLDIAPTPVLVAPLAGGPGTSGLVTAVAGAESLAFVAAGYRSAEQLATDLTLARRGTERFG